MGRKGDRGDSRAEGSRERGTNKEQRVRARARNLERARHQDRRASSGQRAAGNWCWEAGNGEHFGPKQA
eukprot:1803396-Pleurochrysis_carterae.AAC.1